MRDGSGGPIWETLEEAMWPQTVQIIGELLVCPTSCCSYIHIHVEDMWGTLRSHGLLSPEKRTVTMALWQLNAQPAPGSRQKVSRSCGGSTAKYHQQLECGSRCGGGMRLFVTPGSSSTQPSKAPSCSHLCDLWDAALSPDTSGSHSLCSCLHHMSCSRLFCLHCIFFSYSSSSCFIFHISKRNFLGTVIIPLACIPYNHIVISPEQFKSLDFAPSVCLTAQWACGSLRLKLLPLAQFMCG